MGAQLLSSKIVVQEDPPSLRVIQNIPTGVLACSGITSKGPVGLSTLLTSFEQYVKIFGSDIANGIATSAVRGFFAGGGQRMYFTRIVHYSDITNANSKSSVAGTLNLLTAATAAVAAAVLGTIVGPYALLPGDTLLVSRDALGTATSTFTATRAAVSAGNAPTYALANNQTLTLKINGGSVQTITFVTASFVAIAAATTAEVNAVINAALAGGFADVNVASPRINSTQRGSGSRVEITGGTANTALGFSTVAVAGTGNVADVSAITVAEIKTIVELATSGVTVTNVGGAVRITSNTTGSSSSVQVTAPSTADDELGLDNAVHLGGTGASVATLKVDGAYDGAYSANVTVLIGPATSGDPSRFNLTVLYNGSIVNAPFPNLSMLDSDPLYVETIVNATDGSGSDYIHVTDLDASPGAGALAERPANGSGSPAVAFGPLTGGNDGLSGLADIDFVGDASSHLGFHSFDLNDDADVLICPERATPAVHNAALSYTSVTRNGEMFFIADPPAGLTAAGIVTYVTQTAAILSLTEDGAIYWPRVKVLNPNASIYGAADTIIVPPSGHIAGMYARTDGARVGGVYDPPGGVEKGLLPGVVGFESDQVLDEAVRDLIAPNLINPITRLRGQPIACDDVMTLKADGNFPTIAERRGVSFIERSIKDGLQFARIRNNDESLRDEVDRTITAFLLVQMRLKAFRSMDPAKAFYVDVGDALNPPTEQFANKLNARTGLATQKPSRFLILSFAQDTRAIDEELAAAAG
jgi:hypothetical protein